MNPTNYDIIIIGSGAAGLTAGIYTSRSRLKTLLIEKSLPGGLTATTDWVENYPGFPEGVNGMDLMNRIEKQAKIFGVEFINEEAMNLKLHGEKIEVQTDKIKYNTYALIVASGSSYKKLDIPGEEEFLGRGVSYCATCDGPLFRDRDVVVVGGGDQAVEEGLFLTKFCQKVTLIHRRNRFRAAQILQERAKANPKVEFFMDSVVTGIFGKDKVEGIKVKNVKTGNEIKVTKDGIFIFIGTEPNTKFLQGLINMDEAGYIITDDNMKTSVNGVFACGDVRKKLLRQIITACGEGATAAVAARHYVEELKGIEYR